jgi:hypothetical protein
MSNFGQVNTDLVGSARLEPAREQGRSAAEFFDDFIVSNCAGTLPGVATNSSAAVPAVRDQRQVNRPACGFNHSFYEREIDALHGVSPKQSLEWAKRTTRRDQDNRTGGVPVEAVDDADIRPFRLALPRQVSASVLQQGATLAIWRRLGQHSGRLVNDQDVTILIKDSQPLTGVRVPRAIGPEGKRRANLDLASWLETGLTTHIDAPEPNRFLGLPSRQPESRRYQLIQTHPHDHSRGGIADRSRETRRLNIAGDSRFVAMPIIPYSPLLSAPASTTAQM